MGKSEKNNTYKNFLAYIFLTAIKPTRFDGFSIIAAQNNRLSKGEYPLCSGFPIGASSIPVGTRFSIGKSSVLYLCFRLTLERDWVRHLLCGQIAVDRHFSAAVGQADFVQPRTKSEFAKQQNLPVWKRKQRYIKAFVPPQRNALIPPWQLQP